MADLVLIYPKVEISGKLSATYFAFGQPMGIFSIGSFAAERGYSVKLIDARIYDSHCRAMEEIIANSKDAKIIGLSVMTAQIEHALIISKELREKCPEKIIVWGGVHPSLFPEQTIASPFVDYVVVGEGEKAIIRLLEGGCAEKIIRTEMLAGEEIPKMNFELVPVERYIPSRFNKEVYRKLDYATSRGCLFRCAFCINVVLWKRKYRMLPPKRVLDEVEELITRYNLNAIWFIDEDMFGSKNRVREILNGIIERKLNFIWRAHLRVNYFHKDYIDEDFLRLMYKAGCREIGFGVESGSERVRELIKKDITEEQVLNSASLCAKAGIRPEYSFMCAIPTESREEFFQTLDLIDKIKKRCPESVILGPQPYRPYPGGELYDLAIKLGLKLPSSLEEWVKETDLFASSLKPEKFPWVDRKVEGLYENAGKYVTIGTRKFSQVWDLSKWMLIPWIVSRLRWRMRFFGFPLDWRVYKFVSRLRPFY